MKQRVDAYQVITDRIIGLLEAGTVPWHKPWSGSGEAKNLTTGKPYRGINRLLLNITAFTSPYWATFNQINKRGGRVRKGEKSMPVVLWKWIEKEDSKTGETVELPLLRYYRVFNLDQVEGIEPPEDDQAEEQEFTPIERCERIIQAMPTKPMGIFRHQRAFYSPDLDLINMPRPEAFDSTEYFYSSLFHEMAHSTGHLSRLNRPTLTDMAPSGSTNYSKEELVAEMTAAMLCGVTGIVKQTIDNSAAYINAWLKRLSEDRRLVVQAASLAQKAADYIQGLHPRSQQVMGQAA